MLLLVAVLLTGCVGMEIEKSPAPVAPTNADGVETWDLRTRPTAEYVGMEQGRNTVSYGSRDPRQIVLLLPQDVDWELSDVRLVVFEGPYSREQDGLAPDPDGVAIKRPVMSLSRAAEQFRADVATLSMSATHVSDWLERVRGRDRGAASPVRANHVTQVGDYEVTVTATYRPSREQGDRATVSVRLNFRAGRR